MRTMKWLMAGMAIGAGIALLYAPQTGKQTRKLIRRKAADARDILADTGEAVLDQSKNIYEKSAKAVTVAAGGMSDLYHKAVGA
jgi:gas vesicle protein